MLSITKSMALHGLEGFLIDVQVDISSGMPSWDIVGLPDVSVKEAKERVRTAIKNSGYELFSNFYFFDKVLHHLFTFCGILMSTKMF